MTELQQINDKLDHVCTKVDAIDATLRGTGQKTGLVGRMSNCETVQSEMRKDMTAVKKVPGKVLWAALVAMLSAAAAAAAALFK